MNGNFIALYSLHNYDTRGEGMVNNLLDQTIFGVYEVFANIIPGTIVLTTCILAYPSFFGYVALLPESFLLVLLFFLAFILGLALQGLSAFMERPVNQKKYGGYPSSLFLKDNDETFPKYFKNKIRELSSDEFGTPSDATPQHVFDLCYAYITQKRVSERVAQFLRTYTFARNMMVTMIIEAVMFLILSLYRTEAMFALTALISIGLSYLFYRRFLRYSESFAKEVLRSFFMDKATEKEVKE